MWDKPLAPRLLRAGIKGLSHHTWPPSLAYSPGNGKHQLLAPAMIICIFISYVDASGTLATWLGTVFVSILVALLSKLDCSHEKMFKAMIFMFHRSVLLSGNTGPKRSRENDYIAMCLVTSFSEEMTRVQSTGWFPALNLYFKFQGIQCPLLASVSVSLSWGGEGEGQGVGHRTHMHTHWITNLLRTCPLQSSRLLLSGHLDYATTADGDGAWWVGLLAQLTHPWFLLCYLNFFLKKKYSIFIYSLFFSVMPQVFRFWPKNHNMKI